MRQRDLDRLMKKIERAQARLQPLLPEIDPHDLQLILERMFRPVGSGRRFFLRKSASGYVF